MKMAMLLRVLIMKFKLLLPLMKIIFTSLNRPLLLLLQVLLLLLLLNNDKAHNSYTCSTNELMKFLLPLFLLLLKFLTMSNNNWIRLYYAGNSTKPPGPRPLLFRVPR